MNNVLNDKYREFFLEAYRNCSTHEIDEANKRDRVIAFYLAISMFFIYWLPGVMNNNFLLFLAWFIWGVLSIFCSLLVINLRSWIIQYTNCAEAIGKLLVADEAINNQTDIAAFLAKHTRKPKDTLGNYFTRGGNILVLGFILISSAPIILMFMVIQPTLLPILFFWLLYCGLLIWEHFRSTNKALSRPKKLTWIVRFDDIQNVLPDSCEKMQGSDQIA